MVWVFFSMPVFSQCHTRASSEYARGVSSSNGSGAARRRASALPAHGLTWPPLPPSGRPWGWSSAAASLHVRTAARRWNHRHGSTLAPPRACASAMVRTTGRRSTMFFVTRLHMRPGVVSRRSAWETASCTLNPRGEQRALSKVAPCNCGNATAVAASRRPRFPPPQRHHEGPTHPHTHQSPRICTAWFSCAAPDAPLSAASHVTLAQLKHCCRAQQHALHHRLALVSPINPTSQHGFRDHAKQQGSWLAGPCAYITSQGNGRALRYALSLVWEAKT